MDGLALQAGSGYPVRVRSIVLVLCLLALTVPARGQAWESPDGNFRLTQVIETGTPVELLMQSGKETRWRYLPSRVVQLAAISRDGNRVVLAGEGWVELLEGPSGRRSFSVGVREPRLSFDGWRSAWIADRPYLETHGGRLFGLESGQLRELEGAERQEVLDQGKFPAASLRLAVIHHLDLHGDWLAACRTSVDDEVRQCAAAYAWSQRQAWGLPTLRKECEEPGGWQWRLVTHGDFRIGSYTEDWLIVPRWLPDLEKLAISALDDPEQRPAAARTLGVLGLESGAEALWRAVASHEVACGHALAMILGEKATEPFIRYLRDNPGPFLDFFERVPCPRAVPILVECLPESESALVFQTRLRLGPEPEPWRNWMAMGQRRGSFLAERGEPSGVLWMAHNGQEELLSYLRRRPRLVWLVRTRLTFESSLALDGDRLVRTCGSNEDPVVSWDMDTGLPAERLPTPHDPNGFFVASRNANRIAVDTPRGVSARELPAPYQALKSPGRVRALSADGRWLLGGGAESTLTDLERSQTRPVEMEGWLAFDPGSRILASTPPLLLTGPEPRAIDLGPQGGQAVELSPDGKSLLVLGEQNLEVVKLLNGDRRMLVSGETAGRVLVSRRGLIAVGRKLMDWEGEPQGEVPSPLIPRDFSPDGSCLIATTARAIEVLELDSSLKTRWSVPFEGDVLSLAMSENNRHLAVAQANGVISVWELDPPDMSQEGQDPLLLAELWTGMRLQGGQATGLTPDEFNVRVERWARGRAWNWFRGLAPYRPDGNNVTVLAGALGILLLIGILITKRRWA